MEIDPEMAALMGFSSFGGMPKKRKFDADDAFMNVQQNAPVAQEPREPRQNTTRNVPVTSGTARSRPAPVPPDPAHDNITLADGSTMSLQALRYGIANKRGDKAYFLPSFLEDPWEKLETKKS
ncbi:hypothetical protein Q7P37_010023 [Cladosporium fusiforme]